MKTVIDLETSVRGYAITGDPTFFERYTEARLRLGTQLADLQRLDAGLPG